MKDIAQLTEASTEDLPEIYCDMDGVLCDFKSQAEKVVGVPINKWMSMSKLDKWKPIVDK